jgi:hypothetical protein
MKSRTIGLAVLLALAAAVPAEAATRCGAKTFRIDETIRTYRGNYLTLCDERRACKAVTYVADKAKPNQWSHRLALMRPAKDQPWTVQLTSVPDQADIAAGFDLGVDGNPPMRVPPEALSSPGSINDYNLNPDLAPVLFDALGPGANVEWRYTPTNGAGPQSVWFSLQGFKSSIRWIDCMQKR